MEPSYVMLYDDTTGVSYMKGRISVGVLNVRLDDNVHEQLKELADSEGVSLSEYVRDLLLEAVVPIEERTERHGDQPAPDTFPVRDRIVLSMLHRILARLLPEDHNGEEGRPEDQIARAEILERGFTGEYWLEVAGFETELSARDSRQVIDILDMYRIITFSLRHLEEEGTPADEDLGYALRFRGFDHNDALEGHMARYVRFLMRDGRHWEELIPQIEASDRGNSHMPVLQMYTRMLVEYRRIMASRERRISRFDYILSVDELQRLADAQIHPDNRGRA